MYAIFSDGNHQYRVEEGQFLDVQRKELPPDAPTIEFDRVLFLGGREGGPKIGQPVIPGAKVIASVLGETKGPKITIRKHRRRKNYKLKKGHRQTYLQLRIDKIDV